MKWDGQAYSEDIKYGLNLLLTDEDKEKAQSMQHKEFTHYFKKCHKEDMKCFTRYAGAGSIVLNCSSNDVEFDFQRELNNLGERTITLSWSMAARHIRAWESEDKETSICTDCINSDESCMKPSNNVCGGYTSVNDAIFKTVFAEKKEDKSMAKKRTFDTAILNDIKSVAGDSFIDNIKMISIEQLHDNKDNFYDLSDLDTLIEDIDRQGLKTPLYVVPDNNGYTIISGHRRKAAVQELINSGKYGTDKLPCYIGSKKSEAETMLDLIMLNATTRVISDADTVKQCEKLEEVFKALEADGKKIQGRMRDKIAAALNVSPAQVGKVENIRHNAIDEVKAAVDEGKMSISTANEIAKLEPEKQKDLVEKKKPEKITHKEVKKSVEAAKKSTSPIQKLKVINDRLENGDKVYEDGSEDITFDEYDRKKDSGMSHSAKMEQLSALTENKSEKIVVVDPESSYGITNPSASEDPQLTEADIEKAKATAELWKKPPEYFNEIIDSGMCNSIISGYVLLILEEMGIDRPVNIFKTINSVLDFYAAQAARDKFSDN